MDVAMSLLELRKLMVRNPLPTMLRLNRLVVKVWCLVLLCRNWRVNMKLFLKVRVKIPILALVWCRRRRRCRRGPVRFGARKFRVVRARNLTKLKVVIVKVLLSNICVNRRVRLVCRIVRRIVNVSNAVAIVTFLMILCIARKFCRLRRKVLVKIRCSVLRIVTRCGRRNCRLSVRVSRLVTNRSVLVRVKVARRVTRRVRVWHRKVLVICRIRLTVINVRVRSLTRWSIAMR